ncbi:MAG TPA: DUF4127 family protein [Candidatus Baltobacteraceae bacterium]|nr:DUF4127 family protein [Candidatus Baltobacteraceae bacterium]
MRSLARGFALGATFALLASTSARSASIVLVPLDDRPVTLQLPVLLGRIAGVPVSTPPRMLLGRYLRFGAPDRIIAWMNARAPASGAYVLSSDMLAQGGLVASRVPGTSYADAYFRLREFDRLRARYPKAWIGVFGTVTRLAPTGVPAIGDAAQFFAAYPAWTYLQSYANLHDPLLPSERAQAQALRAQIGDTLLDAYLGVRARNVAIDRLLIDATAHGAIDRLVLGQDDAKPYGLHVPELAQLNAEIAASGAGKRASIEPGADELGMALVAHALARAAKWRPRVEVRYSTPDGALFQDPLEFAPIDTTVDALIDLCGATRVERDPDVVLFVHVPHSESLDASFLSALNAEVESHRSVALADLSFEESYAVQGAFARQLLESGVASRIDAYAAWNTAANTVGTALAEAIAAGAGRRLHTYDALAHREFTFMRFVDDVDFHVKVRPQLNDWLDANGTTDHTYLLPGVAAETADRNRALLWYQAQTTLEQLYPGMHIAAMDITLPWDRTFETAIDARLAPDL